VNLRFLKPAVSETVGFLEIHFRYFRRGVVNLPVYGNNFIFIYARKGDAYAVFAQGNYPDAVFVQQFLPQGFGVHIAMKAHKIA
jgi:hypothetical protein